MTQKPTYKELELKNAKLEDRIKTTEDLLEFDTQIFNSINTGVVIIDAEDHIINNVNTASLSILGYKTKDELIGKNCCDCFCPKNEHTCPITKKNPDKYFPERPVIKKNGEIIPIIKEVKTIKTKSGHKYIIETFRDISEKKKLEELLYKAESLAVIGEAAATIAHDLNNPLSVFSGGFQLIDMILTKLPNSSEKEQIQDILKSSNIGFDMITSMINNLLTYTIESHQNERSEVNLKDNLERCMKLMELDVFYKKEIHTSSHENYNIQKVPLINGVPRHFNQIYQNLIRNAVHSIEEAQINGILESKEKNKLSLSLSYSEQTRLINFSISDKGMGIPENKLIKIFQPHYTTKEKGKGTGLGLSSATDKIKRYGGEIRVETKLGQGTKFDVTIPINQKL